MAIEALGRVGDEKHDNLVKKIYQQDQWAADKLRPYFRQMVRNWHIFFGDMREFDWRQQHEKSWRAFIFPGWPYSSVSSQVAVMSEILTSQTPIIQPDAVGTEDEEGQEKMQALFDHILRKNRFRSKLDVTLMESGVQGMAVRKAVWKKRSMRLFYQATEEEQVAFDKSVVEAMQRGAPPAPPLGLAGADPGQVDMDGNPLGPTASSDLTDFLLWRDLVNTAGTYGRIPEPPISGIREAVQFMGPGWEHVSVFNLRWDPFVDELQDFPFIHQLSVKPMAWVKARTGPGPEFPYDPEQVEAAVGSFASGEDRLNEYQKELAQLMGLAPDAAGGEDDPRYKNRVLVREVWRKGEEHPYLVILNDRAVVNKKTTWPYEHQLYPYGFIRNVLLPGASIGLAEMTLNLPMYREFALLRSLRIDAVTMAVIPILLRMKEVGMPDIMRRLVPGAVLDVIRTDGIRSLNEHIRVPESIFKEIDDIKFETDEVAGTGPMVRGQGARFSRTTAREIERTTERALARQKQRVARIEDDLSEFPQQWAALCYQFAPAEWRIRVTGENPGRDPYQSYSKLDFIEAIESDYRFRGATDAIDKEHRAQVLGELYSRAAQAKTTSPTELRAILRRIFETWGEKGVHKIFTKEGDAYVKALEQASLAQIAMSAQVAPAGAEPETQPSPTAPQQ
jgi:hypothetical protein